TDQQLTGLITSPTRLASVFMEADLARDSGRTRISQDHCESSLKRSPRTGCWSWDLILLTCRPCIGRLAGAAVSRPNSIRWEPFTIFDTRMLCPRRKTFVALAFRTKVASTRLVGCQHLSQYQHPRTLVARQQAAQHLQVKSETSVTGEKTMTFKELLGNVDAILKKAKPSK